MTTTRIVRYGGLIVLLGLLLAGALGFRDVLSAYLVHPVAISLWAIWRIIISVDQIVYWILLVALCALLMIRVFSANDHTPPPPTIEQSAKQQRTRIDHWLGLFRSAGRTRGDDAALRASLRQLVTATISQADRPVGPDLAQALAARHIPLPPRVREYLQIGGTSESPPSRSLSLAARLRRWVGRPAAHDNAAIEEVLRWMETVMEINHDR